MRRRSTFHERRFLTVGAGVRMLMWMTVTHLAIQAGAPTSTHEPIPSKIGYFEGRHLACNLPELADKEDEGPRKLKGDPKCNRNQK